MKNQKSMNFIIGSIIVTALFLLMLISLFYTPYDVTQMNVANKFQKPNLLHPLGTDNFGRDILSRIMKGSQTAFLVGTVTTVFGLLSGIIIGSLAGFFGGIVDEILMRLMDAMMAFPGVLLALMFVSVLEPGIITTTIALILISIPNFARITRSGFLEIKNRRYIDMARCMGVSKLRIMFVHILPNIVSSLIIASSMNFATAILSEAGLSYLGLGVQPPNPSWGRMLSESQAYLIKAPFYMFAPGLMITLAILGFNLLGDGIRDLRDPKRG